MTRTHVLRDVLVPRSMLADRSSAAGMPAGDCLCGDLCFIDGRVSGLQPGRSDIRAAGLVLPLLVEPHCHLDKCHSVDRLGVSATSLAEAISLQAKDKRLWTENDLRSRIARGLADLGACGVGLVRSHVDWGAEAEPLA